MASLVQAIVMGSSAGGLDALRQVFAGLGENFPCPIIVAQHLEKSMRFVPSSIFINTSGLIPIEAADKLPIVPGYIYFAPPGYHLYVESDRCFGLSVDPPVNWSRPSIDLLFESAAHTYGAALAGVLLTGANHDGAAGLARIKERGGWSIAQDPRTAIADVMPKAAIATGKVDFILPLGQIGSFLRRLCGRTESERGLHAHD